MLLYFCLQVLPFLANVYFLLLYRLPPAFHICLELLLEVLGDVYIFESNSG